MPWFFLVAAILSEVGGTCALRVAATGDRRWYALVAVGYLVSFVMLGFTLDAGIGIGVAYGIWAAVGVALTALAARVLFAEPLTRTMGAGIALIACGVLLIELGAAH
jgi:small multidrug resistance pump